MKWAVFAEGFDRTIRNLLKRPVSEQGDANWIDVLPVITKQYNIRVHISTNSTPIQTSLWKSERFAYKNLLEKWKKVILKFQVIVLVRVADIKRTFSKGDTTNLSDTLYKITEIVNDAIPSYRIDNIPERYNEALLKKTELTMKENKDVMKALNLN